MILRIMSMKIMVIMIIRKRKKNGKREREDNKYPFILPDI